MKTQRQKTLSGSSFESEFRQAINPMPAWATKLHPTPAGTPFDFLVTMDGCAAAVELKRIQEDRLPFSRIRDNQREGLESFEKRVDTNVSYVIVRILREGVSRCHAIPWMHIRELILSGASGSVPVTEYPELMRKRVDGKTVWDLGPWVEEVKRLASHRWKRN